MNQRPILASVPVGPTSAATARVLPDQPPPQQNEEILTRYFAAKRTQWRPGTLRLRRGYLNAFARFIDPVPLVEATEYHVLAFHDQLTTGAESITSYISTLRVFYRWLQTKARPQVRTDDPTVLLENPRIPRRQPRPILPRDYQLALACAMNQPEMYAWLGLAGCSGLRCCEIAWMRPMDVEELTNGSGLLHIEGKGGHQRTVPAGADLMTVLRPFMQAAPTQQGPLFRRVSDGQAHSPDQVSFFINRFLREVGVRATAHQLRHRFGTDYHAIDPDVFRQAGLMGHASVNMTRRYSALEPTEAARHVEKLTRSQLSGTAGRVGTREPNVIARDSRKRSEGKGR